MTAFNSEKEEGGSFDISQEIIKSSYEGEIDPRAYLSRRSSEHRLPPIEMPGYSPYPLPMWFPQYDPTHPDASMGFIPDQMMYGGYYISPFAGYNNFQLDRFSNSSSASVKSNSSPTRSSLKSDDVSDTTSTKSQTKNEQIFPPEPLTDVREFPEWMKKFASFLEQYGLKDIVPDKLVSG
ncbi:hypothetical protein HG536_0B06150 [Torulaspora globosa]|uniref:Uncharacterized protein n=1 Tax=Torulaspora globosa TaxID=48254 RepID=A0A7G3ZE13_9SACH|nr:uncharacterized protein HG536_0B06150 [Torulaspora globosa]QLL31749.1 hypothetical protein HG536_0B06150 [Torulaspora globosa]